MYGVRLLATVATAKARLGCGPGGLNLSYNPIMTLDLTDEEARARPPSPPGPRLPPLPVRPRGSIR
jgi:hypothetical protein